MSVAVTFLGGLGEIGRNCAAIEIDGKLALIDCGLMFPEEDMLGVDLVLPDFTSVLDRVRRELLKPGGAIIPRSVELMAAPVQCAQAYRKVAENADQLL